MKIFDHPSALVAAVGEELGPTPWLAVDQSRIDTFADATGDHQWIHVDVQRSREGPFGTTIAHGYLTLALFSAFLPDLFVVRRSTMSLNVGLNRVRFLAPVCQGSRLRAAATLQSAEWRSGGVQIVLSVAIEAEDSDRPSCILEPVIRFYSDDNHDLTDGVYRVA
jgi:acyl dehydratase